MISNEDYKSLKDNSENGLTVLFHYYTSHFGRRLSAGAFMVKFTQWCSQVVRMNLNDAVECIIAYLDVKHEYQGFIENWR